MKHYLVFARSSDHGIECFFSNSMGGAASYPDRGIPKSRGAARLNTGDGDGEGGDGGDPDPASRSQKEHLLQRLFSTFPGGLPGVGLFLLRSTVGMTLLVQALPLLDDGSRLIGSIALLVAAAHLVGFVTPFAALAGMVATILTALSTVPLPRWPGLLVLGTAVLLLGPGAFSIDARLFGRKEIVIPPSPRP